MHKNVLITGAAKRIGAACARLLHSQGYNLILHYCSSKAGALALGQELNAVRPDSAKIMQADLHDMNALESLAVSATEAWGGLDVLVNNASIFSPAPVDQVDEPHWDSLFGCNLKAPFFLAKFLSATLAERQGSIVNITDIHGERGLPGYPVYSLSKAGLTAMTKILAKELGPDIRVNAIAPGAILWPDREISDQEKSDILQRIVLKRTGNPQDIANALLFLIQDAGYLTGQIISVDGGRTLSC